MSAPSQPASRVFVSHSHADNGYCREFVESLRRDGLDVWYDEHNLGWGALRQVIERELQACGHFIAILSPAACASEWVNAEIDAALYLLGKGTLQTVLFVTAERCDVSPLLQRYKRIERPDGYGYSAAEAAARVLPIVRPTARPAATPIPVPSPARVPPSVPPISSPPAPLIPPDQFPARLASLGFVPRMGKDPDTGKEVSFILPPTVPVLAGPFQYGEGNTARSVDLPAFAIARYPVTVAEYACFVRAGYEEPSEWRKQLKRKLDHPVMSVSWHSSDAYAAWLARLSNQPWRLPLEEEWEKAARWDPHTGKSFVYPWGDAFDITLCNTLESGVGMTTPVGKYLAAGGSPSGAEDMMGNIWEWTNSNYDDSTSHRVLCGGSWYCGHLSAAFRNDGRVDIPIIDSGFRLVLAPVQASS